MSHKLLSIVNFDHDVFSDDQRGSLLKEWVLANGFPQFVRISYANFNYLIHSGIIEKQKIFASASHSDE